jgi:hypothetical protein
MYRILVRKQEHFEELDVDGRIILKCCLNRLCTGFICSEQGRMVGPCEHCNETSSSIKIGDLTVTFSAASLLCTAGCYAELAVTDFWDSLSVPSSDPGWCAQ